MRLRREGTGGVPLVAEAAVDGASDLVAERGDDHDEHFGGKLARHAAFRDRSSKGFEGDVRRLWPTSPAGDECVDRRKLLVAELEVEDLGVGRRSAI